MTDKFIVFILTTILIQLVLSEANLTQTIPDLQFGDGYKEATLILFNQFYLFCLLMNKSKSYGGFISAMALLNETTPFQCAISGAPVTDWRLYGNL